MSPSRSASASAGGTGGGGRAVATALIVVGIAVAMVLVLRSRPGVEPFDPRSSRADGANGAVLLLEEYGASVSITSRAPDPGADERVLVISDSLNSSQRRDLLDFVEAGGIAIVADPDSTLHGGPGTDGGAVDLEPVDETFDFSFENAESEANVQRGDCTVAALEPLRGIFTPRGRLFPVGPGEDRCFTEDDHAFVVVRYLGDGLVVGFGDNRIVTNRYLRFADNAGLVTSLLAPRPGASVRVMLGTESKPAPEDIGSGDEKLVDLVRPGIWMAIAQLALAFVVFCIARGVRPGRAVREPQPTPIAGNELVLATGNLMQRAHHFDRAGWLLRGELYRQLVAHYCLPADTSIDELSSLVGRRTGVDASEIKAVLLAEISSAEQLTNLAARIDRLRAATLGSIPESV